MKKTKKRDNKYYDTDANFKDFKSVSGQDCTGLIPTPPTNSDEAESYSETYDFGPEKKPSKNEPIEL